MLLIRNLFWVALFIVSTFCFVVLFEHGPVNYTKNMQLEFESAKKLYHLELHHKKDDSDKIGTGS